MLFAIFLMVVMRPSSQYTPSADTYLLAELIPVLNPANNYMFDGPIEVLNATAHTNTKMPTVTQLMYYNYYAASMYCQYELEDLSCIFCEKFKYHVNEYRVIMNNNTDLTALVTISHSLKEIVVTYRGTANLWNAVLNAVFINININSKIKIHEGFYISTMSLYYEVVKSIGYLRIANSDYRVVIVGHSLGGSMASITLFFLLYLNQFPGCKYELFTYGEPRTGNKAFADYMNAQTIVTARSVARCDIVPHLPPTSVAHTTVLFDYYIHSHTEFWINGEGGQRFCNRDVYEDSTCSNSMGPAYTVIDHLHYFDTELELCSLQPAQFLPVPVIFQPVGTVPPLPDRVTEFLSIGAYFFANVLGPIFGR